MPSEAEIRAAGFAPEDYEDDYFDVWPENWPAVRLFISIGNQWRGGNGLPIALDYGVLFHRLDRMRLSEDEYEQMFRDVKALEAGAIPVMCKPS